MNIILRRWVMSVGNNASPTFQQYITKTDGTSIWRKGVRMAAFVWDHAITPLGFAGNESFDGGATGDWECVFKIPKL